MALSVTIIAAIGLSVFWGVIIVYRNRCNVNDCSAGPYEEDGKAATAAITEPAGHVITAVRRNVSSHERCFHQKGTTNTDQDQSN